MATDGELNDLLAELRAGGEVDSQGRFTLDRAQARAKLQKFQLVDARRYVLELVQAAVLRGATAIDFDIDTDDMRMRFDGRMFTPAELDDLWGSIFADGDGQDLRGVRQLALGLNAALGTNPKRIVVRSGATEVRLQPGLDDELSPINPAITETTIHVKQRVKLVLIVEFLRNVTGLLDEEIYLRNRCSHAPISITLDGKPIVRGLSVADAIASQPIAAPGIRGVIAWVDRKQPAELRLIKDGVWIDSQPLERCGPGLVALVVGEKLRKDVSLAKIVADDALSQIVGMVRVQRWGLFARMIEQVQRGERPAQPTMNRVWAEALQFLRLRDIRKHPDAAIVAGATAFPDARMLDPLGARTRRSITLAELADLLPAHGAAQAESDKLRYASRDYPILRAEGPPIPKFGDEDAKTIARLFSCGMVRVDDELQAATTRELARLVWRSRTMAPALPDFRRYLIRAPLVGPGLTGEFGLEGQDSSRMDGTLWLIRDGCLLAKIELAWGIPALDVVVEAQFEPSESYEDVVRNHELARVCMHVLAGLTGPLAQASNRADVKAWLTLVFDGEARKHLLWERLGIAESEIDDRLAAIVPTSSQLHAGEGPLALIRAAPLFEDFDGTPRSLRELTERRERVGAIDELDRAVDQVAGFGSEVAWLGKEERGILTGLFGESALRSWRPTLAAKQRERAFWGRPALAFADVVQSVRAELQVDPDLWSRTIEADGIQAVIALGHGTEFGQSARIELRIEGRPLTTRVLDLGIGPIFGVASSSALRVTPDWDDVEDDDALRALIDMLRAAAWSLVGALVQHLRELSEGQRWLAGMLLTRLAQPDGERVATRLPVLPSLPLLATIDGGSLSLVELDAVIREHGQIEWVAATTPVVELRNPPMLREELIILDALRVLVGVDKLVEGADRLRKHGLSARLESLPKIDRIELEPGSVWFKASLGQPARAGEIGLSRARTSGGLALELCTLGRRVGVVMQSELPVALEAILDDPELPLLGDGSIDTRSKRYGQLLRLCRRALPDLIITLCKRYEGLSQADRTRARVLLLGYVQAESTAGPGRREARESAWEVARKLPLIVDVWGRWHSLASIEGRSKLRGAVDVVGESVEIEASGEPDEPTEFDRVVLIADGPARACLATMVKLRDLGDSWAQERAALRELSRAPDFQLPDLRQVAWIDRKATVAGGLEAHLWIPRTPSSADMLTFTRGRKQVGQLGVIPGIGCAGVVSGDGLVVEAGGVRLDGKQRTSLAKQICVLYEALARQVAKGGSLNANEREQALTWLVEVDGAIQDGGPGDAVLRTIGKPLERLREALGEIIAPSLRRAIARAVAKAEAVIDLVQPRPVVKSPEPAPAERAPVMTTPAVIEPESLLLTVVRAELEWARARHGALLDRLGLDRLRVGGGKPGVAVFERGIVLQRQHPVVARPLAELAQGREVDPIDLAFLISGVFTVMNAVAQDIAASDELAFIGHMAETLVLTQRAESTAPGRGP